MSTRKISYYDILGISRTADRAEIKRAYKSLASQYHPDRNNDPHAKEFFGLIKEAYDTLSNEKKREAYDKPVYDSMLKHIFGDGPVYEKVHEIYLTLEDAYTGCERPLDGEVIQLPAGVHDGARMAHGNKLYCVRIQPHNVYKRSGSDLLVDIHMNALEALFTQTYVLHHLDGTKLDIVVESPYTGQVLRFSKKGIVDQITETYGDLFVQITVDPFPEKYLTQPLKDAIIAQYTDINRTRTLNERSN